MSIATELAALSTNLQNAKDAVTARGGTIGDTGLAGLASEIGSIPSGGGDVSDYFRTTLVFSDNSAPQNIIKKLPAITLSGVTTINFQNYKYLEGIKLVGGTSLNGMYNMFNGCSALQTVDITEFAPTAITSLGYAFYNCSALTSLDLSTVGVTTSESSYLMYAFSGCLALSSLVLPSFSGCRIASLQNAFSNCVALESLDCSGWNTARSSTQSDGFKNAFSGCSSLKTLNISGWTCSNSLNSSYIFSGCTALESIIIDSPSVFEIGTNAFLNVPSTALVYVPDSLVASYQSSTSWINNGAVGRIRALSELNQ